MRLHHKMSAEESSITARNKFLRNDDLPSSIEQKTSDELPKENAVDPEREDLHGVAIDDPAPASTTQPEFAVASVNHDKDTVLRDAARPTSPQGAEDEERVCCDVHFPADGAFRYPGSEAVDEPFFSRRPTLHPYEKEEAEIIRKRAGTDAANVLKSLLSSAVQVCVEFYGMTRLDWFGEARCFAALFTPGSSAGYWTMLERGESMRCTERMRCFKKFRLRAATQADRADEVAIALFDAGAPAATALAEMRDVDLLTVAWAYATFNVVDLLASDDMILERGLRYGKRGLQAKGSVSLVLDVIQHMKQNQRIAFDIGFADGTPRRNRMYFEVCRALRRGKWSPLYKSEVRCREEADQFDIVTFDAQDFHGGDSAKLFRIEVYRWYKNGNTKLLGFIQTSYEKLKTMNQNDQLYWWPAQFGIESTKMVLEDIKRSEDEACYKLRMASMF